MSEVKIGLDNLENCAEDDREWYENDLQLAAELGMALLKRNQELENIVYQKQLIIDDQLQEIELLTRQANTLRELNESRLKVYEQLEQSISELEKINQKLHCESSVDKKRIQNLCNSVELLEKKCEELESMVDDLRISNNKNYPAFAQTDISVLDENSILDILPSEEKSKGTEEESEIIRLQNRLSQLSCQLSREQEKYYNLELERDILIQENAELQNVLQTLEESNSNNSNSSVKVKSIEKNQKDVLSVLENNTEDEEQELSSQECILVQLKNGVVAYGNRESLETACDTIEEYGDKKNSVNGISLLTELDAQYKDLMEKYDILIGSRKQVNFDDKSSSEIHENIDFTNTPESKPDSIIVTSNSLPCQRNCKYVDVGVQTEITGDTNLNCSHKKILNLSATNSLSGHFDHSCPTYKKLFEEIFTILKRSLQIDATEKSESDNKSLENDRKVFNNDISSKVTINQNSCRKFTYAEVLLNGKTQQKVIPL